MVMDYCDILIISASYGGGHNQVARALTMALQNKIANIRIITVDYCDLLQPVVNRLSQFGYNKSIRHFPVGYALYYQATGKISSDSFWQRRLNRLGYSELIMLVNRLKPKVIVSTFPLPAGVLSEMKDVGDLDVPLVTVITDFCVHSQWIHPHTNLYIVGSKEVSEGLTVRGIAPERIAAVGIPLLPTFKKVGNNNKLKENYGFNLNDRIVLFMGGSDGLFGNIHFNNLIYDWPSNVKALVITGSNNELYEKLGALKVKNKRLQVLKEVDNISNLMEISDVLVTKAGGITISEALVKCLPMIIYRPTPGHEEANARFLWRHRAALVAKGEQRLKTAIQRMIADEEFRQRFINNCKKISKPNAAEDSTKLILSFITPLTRHSHFDFNNAKSLLETK